MGVVVTTGRLFAVVSIAVILTFGITILIPMTPVVVYPGNVCLVMDPPPAWCANPPDPCGVLGCGPPPCDEFCPYDIVKKSLVDIWMIDQEMILENTIQFDTEFRNLFEMVGGNMTGDMMAGDKMMP